MPIRPVEWVDQPAVVPRYVADNRSLGALASRGADLRGQSALMRGQNSAQMWEQLAQLFMGMQGEMRRRREQQTAQAIRLQEQQSSERLRRDETAARIGLEEKQMVAQAAERAERAAERKQQQDEQAAIYRAGELAPGPIGRFDAQILQRFPGTAGRVRSAQSLPARPVSPDMGPMGEPERFDVLEPTAAQVRQSATDALTRENAKKLDESRRRDDTRADEQLDLSRQQLRVSQQNANTAARAADARQPARSGVAGEYADLIDSATINLPSTRRRPIIEGIDRRWQAAQESGDRSELNRFIKLAAVENEPVDDRRQITGRGEAAAALTDIRKGLAELKSAGIDTNILRGTVEDVARKLGTSTDPRLVAISTRIMDAYIQYRRSLTGVAFSEREAADYAKLFPNYSNTLPVNEAVLDGLERSMRTRDDAYWRRKFGDKGAALLSGRPVVQPSPTEPPASSSSGPAIGTQRTINGQLAEWDGRGWLPVRK